MSPLGTREEIYIRQYETLMETYSNHFDLFIKGMSLYFLIVGASAGVAFTEGSPRRVLVIFIAFTSIVGVFGVVPCYIWVRHIGKQISELEDYLGMKKFSFTGAKSITILFGLGMLIVAFFAIYMLNSGASLLQTS